MVMYAHTYSSLTSEQTKYFSNCHTTFGVGDGDIDSKPHPSALGDVIEQAHSDSGSRRLDYIAALLKFHTRSCVGDNMLK